MNANDQHGGGGAPSGDLSAAGCAVHLGEGAVGRWSDRVVVVPPGAGLGATVDALAESADLSGLDWIAWLRARAATLPGPVAALVAVPGGYEGFAVGAAEVVVADERLVGETGQLSTVSVTDDVASVVLRGWGDQSAPSPVSYDLGSGMVPGRATTIGPLTVPAAAPASVPEPVAPVEPPVPAPEPVAPVEAPAPVPEPVAPVEPPLVPPPAPAPIPPAVAPPGPAVPVPGGPALGSPGDPDDALAAPAPPPPPAGAPVVAPPPPPVTSWAADAFEVIPLGGNADGDRAPLPIAGGGEVEEADEDQGEVMVPGVLCSRGHFNNPSARFCMVCGISMLHQTRNTVLRPRPTLGFVVFDDGTTYALDREYLIGRDPQQGAETRGAEPLVVTDAERTVSRDHASISLDVWDVVVTDHGSTNGSFVWNPPAQRWERLEPERPRRLDPGASVAVGRRTFVFESVLRTGDDAGPAVPPPTISG